MGLCVFLLICGPAAALLYFPLTTRMRGSYLTPAVVSKTPAGSTSATGSRSTIGSAREADSLVYHWKSAA
jgi:hypothetical protein